MKKSEIKKLQRKVLRGITECADIMFDLNQECVKAGEPAMSLRSTTCYFCELLGTAEENLEHELKRK